jgi:hypothetical protein
MKTASIHAAPTARLGQFQNAQAMPGKLAASLSHLALLSTKPSREQKCQRFRALPSAPSCRAI